ncbi:hypothetical protein [Reichenbachiella sp.]|uniref:hypothetical protein n=1 Tax=Reichenbachiella sp. TaxID=2184521 RepID=UPI003B5BD000
MSIQHITHEGKAIMYADYSACKQSDQQLALLEEVAVEIAKTPEPTLLLVSYEGVSGGIAYMNRLKELGNTVFKEHMKCSAVLGINGIKKILFNGYNRATGATNVSAFDSRDEALDWLVKFE